MSSKKPPVRSEFSKAARKTLLGVALAGAAALGVGALYETMTSDGSVPITYSEVKPLNGANSAAHDFPTRPSIQATLDQKCEIPGVRAPEEQNRDFNELQEYGGNFTRAMLSYAKGAEIYTCYYSKPAIAGTYDADAGVVRVNKLDSDPGRLAQDINATALGFQDIEGLRLHDSSWNLYSRVMQKLAGDAIAQSATFVAAVDLRASGDSSVARFHDQQHTPGWAPFIDTYTQTHDVNAASSAAVNALLRDPGFITAHADGAIDAYWNDWSHNRIRHNATDRFTAVDLRMLGQLPGGVHLADDVVTPSEQSLLKAAPDLARAFEVLAPANQGTKYARKLGKPGDFYTARQAIAKLDTQLTGQFNYPARKDFAGFNDKCAQADYTLAQVPDTAKTLWQDAQTLRNGGPMSAELIAFADRADIAYCSMKDMPSSLLGLWQDNDGVVRVNPIENTDEALTVEAHETLHGIQRTTHVGNQSNNWTIHDAQMTLLSFEGSARVAQYLVALELHDKGIDGPYNAMQKDFPQSFPATRDAYEAAKKQGLNHAQVLQAAGAAGWRQMFNDWPWVTVYNNNVLKNFIWRVMANVEKAPDGTSYSLDTARKTGFISNDLNFTATIPALPDYKDRFAGNVRMRQAFDYINLVHLTRTLGVDNPATAQERARMTKEGNPFFGLDMNMVNNALSRPDNTWTAIDAMNCFSGLSKGCTYAGKPFNASDFKPKLDAPSV